jgi:hypothetical protein
MQHNEGTSNDDDCLDAVPPYEKDNSIDSASVIDSSTEITRLMCSGQISSPKLKSLDKITVQEALEMPEIVGASETGFEIAEKRPISPRTYTSNFENNSPVDPVCEHDLDDISSPIRESSAPTDVYEPPEPRANQDVATCVFTPPFSPVPLDNVESKEFSIPPSSHSQADEALTGNGQVSKTVNSSDLEMLEVCCLNSPVTRVLVITGRLEWAAPHFLGISIFAISQSIAIFQNLSFPLQVPRRCFRSLSFSYV